MIRNSLDYQSHKKKVHIYRALIWVVTFLLLGGCASSPTPTPKSSPETDASYGVPYSYAKNVLTAYKNIVILPLQFSVYETSVGEVSEKIPDWSEQAKGHLLKSIKAATHSPELNTVTDLTVEQLSSVQTEMLSETQALFDVVGQSVWQHVQSTGAAHFAGRSIADYTLGADISTLHPDADAYVLFHGLDQVSTGGRIAKKVVTSILLAALGVAVVPAGGLTKGTMGVVDAKTGKLLWLSTLAFQGKYDIRTGEGANAFIKHLTWKSRES
ncbi:hypothetical protein [Nitrospira sp. M1]